MGISGVFRISIRRERGSVGAGRVRYIGGGLETSPEKKSFFVPKVIILGAFYAVFNRQKNGQSREALVGHGIYGSIAKRSLQKYCKNYPKNSPSYQREAVAPSPPPPPKYATGGDGKNYYGDG